MPNVSVIIPTHNRPDLLRKAVASVLGQTYRDFEVIVVDVGLAERAGSVIREFNDPRLIYKESEQELNGSAARNMGIRAATGRFIAFLDDDDQWLSEKLAMQMAAFESTPPDVGFCACALNIHYNDRTIVREVPAGIGDHSRLVLSNFHTFFTSTLVIKRAVFDAVGYFDEELPSHQEAELMIRITQQFKGLGINKPLVEMNASSDFEHVATDIARPIRGREILIKRHLEILRTYPMVLANHYFWLGIQYRDRGNFPMARMNFGKALKTKFAPKFLFHYLSVYFGEAPYRALRSLTPGRIRHFLLRHEPFRPEHMGEWIRMLQFKHYFKKYIARHDPGAILDVGCGGGEYAYWLAGQMPRSSVVGYDIRSYPEWMRYRFDNLVLQVRDITTLDDVERYDFVYSIDVLEHINDNVDVIDRLHRALKRNGLFYLAVPCEAAEHYLFPRSWFARFDEWAEHEHTARQYRLREWRQILVGRGFDIALSRYTFTFWGHIAWELELLLMPSVAGQRLNILLMPFYKILGILDLFLPIGSGNSLFIARKK